MARTDDAGEGLARRTRRLLAECGRRPRRSRGQNFLIDPKVADRVAGIVAGDEAPRVIEIGAGLGALTEPLARRCSRVVAIELEEAFARALDGLVGEEPHVRVVQADALKADFAQLCGGDPARWRVVGNLPYHAATAIVLRLFAVWPAFERIAVTVQREVGERLLASPDRSDYGSLSVVASYYLGRAKAVVRIPRGAFYPQPKVDSTMLVLEPRGARPEGVKSEALLFAVIRAGFGQRRKQLMNALVGSPHMPHIDRESARQALLAAGAPEKARAQELSLEAFIRVANALWESGVRPLGSQ